MTGERLSALHGPAAGVTRQGVLFSAMPLASAGD